MPDSDQLPIEPRPGLGEVAYTAYGAARRWMAVGGSPMPSWDEQDPAIRVAWVGAAYAAVAAWRLRDEESSDG